MPSPFPGMAPFIDSDEWSIFQSRFVFALSDMLVPALRPKYIVRPEERVYLEQDLDGGQSRLIIPDVVIADAIPSRSVGRTATAMAIEPVHISLPMPELMKERYLTIRRRGSLEVVTIIEVLSPANKRAGSSDRSAYLTKRDEILWSDVYLVELDLLRGGRRLPTTEPLPLADFFAIISRNGERPNATAYPWMLRQPLPTIPIPLSMEDPDVALDLQEAFTTVYDSLGYDYSLDYSQDVEPVLMPEDEAWVKEVLSRRHVTT